jgi:deoxyribonuclease V
MDLARPDLRPDPSLDREAMVTLQREVASAATFADDLPFDPGSVSVGNATLAALAASGETPERPLVAGIDQAFLDDRVVSAVVVLRGGSVVERTSAVSPLEYPYVPGFLTFREGEPILEAFAALDPEPDLVVFDGSGRIHFRQAGIAVHAGVVLGVPAVGVAKSLLCGRPVGSTGGLAAGERVAIEAGDDADAPTGTVIGYAVQTRQFDSPNRHVNPVYVSPGHRVGAKTAADLVLGLCDGYKLPEPTRLADTYAEELKTER